MDKSIKFVFVIIFVFHTFDLLYRELSSTFARLCHLVDSTTADMEQEVKQLDEQILTLEELSSAAKLLKNKANYLINELNLFDKAYLSDKS
jgi:mitofusin